MDSAFKVRITGRDQLLIRMSGAVNEHADFAPVKFATRPAIEIDVGEMTMINSTGLRSFSAWINGLENDVITISHCPKFFVEQVNMVGGLLPARAKVISFYVPYYCSDSDKELNILYRQGLEFVRAGDKFKLNHPEVGGQDESYEMDVVPAKYFRFLSRYG